MISCIYSRQFH